MYLCESCGCCACSGGFWKNSRICRTTTHMEFCTYVKAVDVVDALKASGGIVKYMGILHIWSYVPM